MNLIDQISDKWRSYRNRRRREDLLDLTVYRWATDMNCPAWAFAHMRTPTSSTPCTEWLPDKHYPLGPPLAVAEQCFQTYMAAPNKLNRKVGKGP